MVYITLHFFFLQVKNRYPDIFHSVVSPILLCLTISPFMSITFGSLDFAESRVTHAEGCKKRSSGTSDRILLQFIP